MNDRLYLERSVLFAFCRTPVPKTLIKRYKKRVNVGDAQAMFGLGCIYDDEGNGLPQDYVAKG